VSFREAALGPTKGQAQISGTKEKGLTKDNNKNIMNGLAGAQIQQNCDKKFK